MLVDTHAHLFWESFASDFDEVVKRALEANVSTIINVGVDLKTSDIVTKLTSDKIQFLAAIGIHPEESVKYFDGSSVSIHTDIDRLEEIYRNVSNLPRLPAGKAGPTPVVAIGECGLDYLFANNPWPATPPADSVVLGSKATPESKKGEDSGQARMTFSAEDIKTIQKQLFQAQIDLAKKLQLPLLVHCRDDRSKDPQNTDAWNDIIEMTKDHYGIYHCYSGLPRNTQYILDNTKFLISFAGNLTYPKNEYLRESAKLIPIERLCIETDCPFLPPQNNRGQRNEPAYIVETLNELARIKEVSPEKLATQISKNLKRVFDF